MAFEGTVRATRSLLDALSEDLLGWTFPPPARAIADAEWVPDDPLEGGYCLRCGDSTGPGEATPLGCGTCRPGAELAGGIGGGVIRLGPYVDSLRRWVLAIKYKHWEEMAETLGRSLGGQVARSGLVDASQALVVPMPMPWQRRWYRGIDHAEALAHGVGSELRAPVIQVLAKKNGAPQTNLVPSERRRAGGRLLRIRRRLGGWRLEGAQIILVDDVRTTGASLKAAVRLIQTLKPAKIVCAVVGVSDAKARMTRAASKATMAGAQAVANTVEIVVQCEALAAGAGADVSIVGGESAAGINR